MKLTTRRIAFAGILAAVYAALTVATSSFAYGPVQFRIAEALAVFCCFTPAAIPGMVVGCMAANLASFVSAWDFAIGSTATLLACLVTWFMSKALRSEEPLGGQTAAEGTRRRRLAGRRLLLVFLVPLPTILFNAVIVGAEIAWFFDDRAFLTAWCMNGLSVGAGEAAVLYVLGVPLLIWLLKDRRLNRQLCAI
jgi:uncharacterized membrane protein